MYTHRTQPAICVFALVLLCASSLVAQAPRTAPAPSVPALRGQWIQMATAIGDDYFDGKDTRERVRRHMKIARAAGVRYLRCGFSWNGIEPERGQYRFEFWDMLVTEAAQAGITLIPYVAYTPEWAAATEEGFWKQPPSDPADYARVMRTLAQRYRGKISHWELWNEPDNKEYWTGSPDQFATMIIAAAKAVREVAPEAKLVLGGMSQGPGEFFENLISYHHLQQHVDILALHAYPESWHEERAETTFGRWIEEMNAVAKRSQRKLWLNEMGYADYRYQPAHASLWGTNTYYAYEHTQRYAADFLFKSFTMTLASGDVSLAGWYRIDDFRESDPRMPQDKVHHHLGITDVNGRPKPPFYALRFFNSLFSKPARTIDVSTNPESQAVIRLFERKDNHVIVTGWLRSSEYREVSAHSGMLTDARRERVDVPLPCTAAKVTAFSALGTPLRTSFPHRKTLANVQLRGDRVFVADVACAPRRAPAP